MIHPFHFGASARRLFGAYHEPSGTTTDRGAVVLCHPTGHEYFWAHRAFRQLAEQLAAAGAHVLRFDYYGTGDSAGEAEEASLWRWTEDVIVAADELKDMCGARTVSLLGLRVGAALANRAAAGRDDVDRMVLWDPVVSGRLYLDEAAALHEALASHPTPGRTGAPSPRETRELLGVPLSPEMESELDAVLLDTVTPVRRGVMFLVSEERPEHEAFRAAPAGTAHHWDYRHVPGAGRWDQMGRVGTALLPRDAIAAATAWLTT